MRMSQAFRVQLEKPVGLVKLLEQAAEGPSSNSAEDKGVELLKQQKERLAQVCQALQDAANKVNEFHENLCKGHKEQIAKLSVEIARKILVQKVEKGDYEIESIVKEALKNSPTREDVAVHLNPDDLVQCQKVQQDEPNGTLAGVRLVADPNIGRAECLLETPKGIVESFINEHIERIGEALKKVE